MILQSRWFSVSGYYIELQALEHFVTGNFNIPLQDKELKVPFKGIYTEDNELAFTVEWSQFLNEKTAFTAFCGYFNKEQKCIELNWLLSKTNHTLDDIPFINTGCSIVSLKKPPYSLLKEIGDQPHPFMTHLSKISS